MKTISSSAECLNYEQLQLYVASADKEECTKLYLHISSCELCSCAVNGFAAIPFISDDLVAIHREMDKKTIATHTNPLTFAQVCIVVVSLISVFSFYSFMNNFCFSHKRINIFPLKQPSSVLVTMPKKKREPGFSNSKIAMKMILIRSFKKQGHTSAEIAPLSIEKIQRINLRLPEMSNEPAIDISATTISNTDIIYIYDLKVADYSRLYFKNTFTETALHNHTPSFKENKKSVNDFSETTNIDAHSILKKGLYNFNRGHYYEAMVQFKLLLENNPNDVNALFYTGSCLYQIGDPLQATEKLEAVLQNTNNAFYQDAKWKLALAHLKTGNKQTSKQLFMDMVAEKGIYSKQAEERLKGF